MNISLNRCNLPPWVIASCQFNEHPVPLEIQGVRSSNAFLFRALDALDDPVARALTFDDWISVRFQLHSWAEQATPSARRSLKNSYLRFLRGWGMDASSIEGAVLKGWVESRMGIAPCFHRAPIRDLHGPEYARYALDRTRGSACTSAILDQLDLVYTFTQYELARRRPGERWVTLWRGVNDPGDHEVVAEVGRRERIVRLNNLCSFTDDRERAWEFGSTVWEVRVALPRVFLAPDVFPRAILRGEREWLAVGGEARVRRVLG
ncbi:NAD(+)--dinitrogen-reductase ADP-D-ribosyltransferase [Anaeromyxobacter sp. Fw109-5]|uniref:NAD(+)--dinitrogen-reductase ADP-D-ribosyltransferase n=1 Tax=Anaeromyxobacter sp. (strain Fw109-5) TaxID=404589 RepID=UPI0000ED8A1C|nr:NAD(+)--dinitrogen-reductase ADP-D-ribosyltransferase [Anaeromyxobacter sp. Fw109-5]ABS27230.1 NAD(+)--dinitrogen-reductase ADP-D-ribosyltransferase [Anaeromyxobacter sp. Fw109-5]